MFKGISLSLSILAFTSIAAVSAQIIPESENLDGLTQSATAQIETRAKLPSSYLALKTHFYNWQNHHINDQIRAYVKENATHIDRKTLNLILKDLKSSGYLLGLSSWLKRNSTVPDGKTDGMRQVFTRGTIIRDWKAANGVRGFPSFWTPRAAVEIGAASVAGAWTISKTGPAIYDFFSSHNLLDATRFSAQTQEFASNLNPHIYQLLSEHTLVPVVAGVSLAAAWLGAKKALKDGIPQTSKDLHRTAVKAFFAVAGGTAVYGCVQMLRLTGHL